MESGKAVLPGRSGTYGIGKEVGGAVDGHRGYEGGLAQVGPAEKPWRPDRCGSTVEKGSGAGGGVTGRRWCCHGWRRREAGKMRWRQEHDRIAWRQGAGASATAAVGWKSKRWSNDGRDRSWGKARRSDTRKRCAGGGIA